LNVPRKDDLQNLMEEEGRVCISIYLPTYRAGKEVAQNSIRFKNLLRDAEESLLAAGTTPSSQMEELLEPAQRLLEDDFFWRNQSDGLAVYLSSRGLRCYPVPLKFEELTVVTERFHIKPLLRLFTADGLFYVLALSQNEVRLFQGTHYSVSEVDCDDLGIPQSLAEITQFESPEKELQFHTGAPGRPGGRDAIFYGTGAGDYDKKDALLRYFREIDKGLQSLLANEPVPLVVAGVDYLLPLYKQVTACRLLAEESIVGNPEDLSPEELHQKAWAIVKPLFERQFQKATDRYKELAGKARKTASKELDEVVPAAYHGRIEVLFVAVGVQRWGTFNLKTGSIRLYQERLPGHQDLLDFAAVHALQNSGMVYALESERLPHSAPVAAIFRY
jgi:hypothetical protein